MRKHIPAKRLFFRSTLILLSIPFCLRPAAAQTAFDVASIRPSSAEVKFERDGNTEVSHGTLRMRDVTISTCIRWAYGVAPAQIVGDARVISDVHYDITAKAEGDTSPAQMKLRMQTLLADRFKLAFHREKKELKVYTLTVAKNGSKIHPAAAPDGTPSHENSDIGFTARSMNMADFATYLSGVINFPITDHTALPGRYDFAVDFTPYVETHESYEGTVRPDPVAVTNAALKGDLGLELSFRKEAVDVFVIDHVEPPTQN
jgi:uncharacterized protein (TIGR03435 family)